MSFQSSLSGINASAQKLDVIGANVSNAQTVGFKETRSHFADLYINSTGATQAGTGAVGVILQQQFGQGNLETSNNVLDMAINGKGFFQVMHPDGSLAYTRNGQFHVEGDKPTDTVGFLKTPDGSKVIGANGPIQIDMAKYGGTLRISSDGKIQGSDGVTKNAAGNLAYQDIATLQLHNFRNIDGLKSLGDNQWGETSAAGAKVSGTPGTGIFGVVQDSVVEASNVDLNNNLVNMIVAQREYQGNSQALKIQIDMDLSLAKL